MNKFVFLSILFTILVFGSGACPRVVIVYTHRLSGLLAKGFYNYLQIKKL